MKHYTVTQAAGILNKSVRAIRQAAETHDDIGEKVGAYWLLDDADLDKLRAMKRGPTPKKPGRKRRKVSRPAQSASEQQQARIREAYPQLEIKVDGLPADLFTGDCTCRPTVSLDAQLIIVAGSDDCPVHGFSAQEAQP